MCGTTCRAALADGDRQLFANVMGFFDEDLFNLFKEKFESGTLSEEVERMPLGIFLRLIKEVMIDEKKKVYFRAVPEFHGKPDNLFQL